jgi:hypothetical protein
MLMSTLTRAWLVATKSGMAIIPAEMTAMTSSIFFITFSRL